MLKKLIMFLFSCILMINLASALVDWTIPSEAELNSNFQIKLFGDKLYFPEITLPDGFEVVLDKSNGKIVDGVYRTYYTSDLDITFRATKSGTFIFKGLYSQGEGVKNLPDKTIKIKASEIEITCPVCPIDEEWSECLLEKQKRNTYVCSAETNFVCDSTTEERECKLETNNNTKSDGTQTPNENNKGFFKKIGNAFSSVGTSIGNFFKKVWDWITFWN